MKPWVIYGLSRKVAEKIKPTDMGIKGFSDVVKKSMHVFVVDASNDNSLNMEMAALESPHYSIHRFGIFFTDSPRHADLLLILGRVSEKMVKPLKETVNQLPEPFGIVAIEDDSPWGISVKDLGFKNMVAYFNRRLEAKEILNVLLNIMEGGK